MDRTRCGLIRRLETPGRNSQDSGDLAVSLYRSE